MRTLLAIFLSIMLSFNAAYAATTDMCDVLDAVAIDNVVTSEHDAHFGHHTHDHDHVIAVDSEAGTADPFAKTVHVDHCHAHQCFTSLLVDEFSLPHLIGSPPRMIGPDDQVVSVSPSRLERPPRVAAV